MPPRPTPHAIVWTVINFSVVVIIGSFGDVLDAVGLGLLLVSIPWFTFYFLDWLGGDNARSLRNELEKRDEKPSIKRPS